MSDSLFRFVIDGPGICHDTRIARHPSESDCYFMARILAYALHHEPGLSFSRGLCAGEEPALYLAEAGGRVRRWIEVGSLPGKKKLRQAVSRSAEVVAYCYGPLAECRKIASDCRLARLHIFRFDPGFLLGLIKTVNSRRCTWQISLNGEMLLVNGISGNRMQLYPCL